MLTARAGCSALLALSSLLFSCTSGSAEGTRTSVVRVVAVHDGDTITAKADRTSLRVRLEGIDCPEAGQPWSQQARKATSEWVFRKDVRLESRGTDDYGRTVGRVFVGDRNLSLELVKAGYAWHFTRYSRDPTLAAAEREARAAKRGLWQDRAPVAPWEWRQRQALEHARAQDR